MAWKLGQLVQTLQFFGVLPSLPWQKKSVGGVVMLDPQSLMVFDFRTPKPEHTLLWGALDDVVMGGVSESSFVQQESLALFTGTVSTANSGGFTSVRTKNFEPVLDLSAYEGIRLRVRGDGNRYKFFLRDGTGWDSLAYMASLNTQNQVWQELSVPFTDFVPVFRAASVPDAPPLDRKAIRSFQVMLSKFERDKLLNPHFCPGRFHLELAWIAAYR
ncbi:MAG: CIA30 family protein [Oscillatoriales cyanobacterium SM2_2_1]|nr:CIA30 family protein [Oscillatoriales cyanobacterium SM2_2_1]